MICGCVLIRGSLSGAFRSGCCLTNNQGNPASSSLKKCQITSQLVHFTDGQGLYNFTNLEAGTYSVTFTLPGFSTVIREGVELTANFTATIERDCTESSLIGTVNRSAPKEVGNNGVPVLYDELLIPFWSRLSFRGQNLLGLRGSV